jgi:hypothetical protein
MALLRITRFLFAAGGIIVVLCVLIAPSGGASTGVRKASVAVAFDGHHLATTPAPLQKVPQYFLTWPKGVEGALLEIVFVLFWICPLFPLIPPRRPRSSNPSRAP